MKVPLEGYRVVDATTWFQSLVGVMLGDLGAEVIKIEERVKGDPMRGALQISRLSQGTVARNCVFEHCNINKKSITLDLKKAEGRKIVYELVEKSDIFVHNFRKGVDSRLVLDYATLSKLNPRLIYASTSGWGPKGPDKERPAYDAMSMARSGIMTLMGDPGGPPLKMEAALADQCGATMTTLAVMTALFMRERTGKGQEVESSLLGSMVHLLGMNIDYFLLSGQENPRGRRSGAYNPLWNHYRCKDDRWIMLGLIQPDRYWSTICQAMGLEHLIKDPRFEDIGIRAKNAAELVAILDATFATKTRKEWQDILAKSGDLIFEPVNTIPDVAADPQVWANGYIAEFDHPTWGRGPMVGFPMHLSGASTAPRLPTPEFGQHTEEILQKVLGYSWEKIARLKDDEVI